jgi:protein KTI12
VLHGKAHTATFATAPVCRRTRAPRAHCDSCFSCAQKKDEAPSFVYDLDRVTQDIVKAVLAAQSTGMFGAGDAVKVPHTTATVTLSRTLGLPELRRLQQQFLKIAQLRPLQKVEEIASSFVDHLTTNA